MSAIAIEKVKEAQLELQQQMEIIKELQIESSKWIPKNDLQLQISDVLHEDCNSNHTDACGYYFQKRDTSYFKRAGKIIEWCKENNIKPDFMLQKHKSMLKEMFK